MMVGGLATASSYNTLNLIKLWECGCGGGAVGYWEDQESSAARALNRIPIILA